MEFLAAHADFDYINIRVYRGLGVSEIRTSLEPVRELRTNVTDLIQTIRNLQREDTVLDHLLGEFLADNESSGESVRPNPHR